MSLPPDDPSAPDFSYETSPSLYLFTSLTAGSSHIITATSRLESILKANRVPFKAVDTATDEKARRIWGRRSQGKKLPGLVKEGLVLADLMQVEEWNEYGELREQLGLSPATARGPVPPASTAAQTGKTQPVHQMELPIREAPHTSTATSGAGSIHQSLAAEAAALAKQRKQGTSPFLDSVKMRPVPTDAKEKLGLSSAAESTATATAAAATVGATTDSTSLSTSPPIKREEDMTSSLDEPTTHNTSTSAALPALPSHLSPSSSPPAQSSISAAPALATAEEAAPFGSAGPASKSGLEAVTDEPAVKTASSAQGIERSAEVSEIDEERKEGGAVSPANKRGSFTKEVSPEEIAVVEGQNIIHEDPREDDAEPVVTAKDENDKELRVKFQEDSLKGATKGGNAAVDSTED